MKKFLLPFAAIALAATLFSSCSSFNDLSIVKRHYRNGFYIHKSNSESLSAQTISEKNDVAALNTRSVAASAEAVNAGVPKTVVTEMPSAKAEERAAAPVHRLIANSIVSENKTPQQHNAVLNPAHPAQQPPASEPDQILLVLLAILLPPVAVFLKEGVTTRFWIDLICWLIGGGFFLTPYFYGSALLLFAVIYAILIVIGAI